jgi:hypothetical protein
VEQYSFGKLIATVQKIEDCRYAIRTHVWGGTDGYDKLVMGADRRRIMRIQACVGSGSSNLHILKDAVIEVLRFPHVIPIAVEIVEEVRTDGVTYDVPAHFDSKPRTRPSVAKRLIFIDSCSDMLAAV